MLPQHAIPPKEGRFPPSHPRFKAKTRPKRMLFRIIRFIFAVGAGWFIISSLLLREPDSSPKSLKSTSSLVTGRLWQLWPTGIRTAESPVHDSTSQDMLDEKSTVQIPLESQENVNSATGKDQDSMQSLSNNVEHTDKKTDPENLGLDISSAALDYLLSTIPSESDTRELLQPVTSTGEKRLHELGLRTRAYKKFFEAWEDVHLVNNRDHTYVRDDIITHMRDTFSESTFPEALQKYETYRHFVTKFATLLFPWTSPYFADHMSLHVSSRHGGRGIVTTAGNSHAPYLLAAIPSFRLLGCDLPIEIMYLGDRDLNEDFRTKLEALSGVTTRDLSVMVNDEGWQLNGWAGKPFSMLLSSFREVMFIDADSLFFINPELLFDDPEYLRTGALFFRDRKIMPESKREWLQKILPPPISESVQQSRMWTGESGHMQESGVVVVDKWMHFVALLLVCRMNGPDRDGNGGDIKGTYDMVFGDKETFWIGWELAGDTSYAFHPGGSGVMGVVQVPDSVNATNERPEGVPAKKVRKMAPGHESDQTICAPQLLHLDREQRPVWFNGWLYENKYAGSKRVGRFDMFMEEPSENLDPAAWQLEESNLCCLSNSAAKAFTTQETEWLEVLIGMAKTVEPVEE
ncbi:CAZyme family GT71 [Penicillium roqueforti]|nr:CAZyme family GT71 [Penicillium roqueforti]KAI2705370.1 CAZyme family GT71 [Penicillium roqueforti]KAI2731599.1 CAZyme family GT71 [Penicillium roqueforti]KAI3166379.1 CAZyme family GT71 [Penicillium roqueforti]KAI3243006.1 CAZyme family GT71 [Penicillium roqueforti]